MKLMIKSRRLLLSKKGQRINKTKGQDKVAVRKITRRVAVGTYPRDL